MFWNRDSQLARRALAFILAVGFALPYGIAVGYLNEVRKVIARGKIGPWSSEAIFIRVDGAPLITRFTLNRGYDYRTLDDEPVPAIPDHLSINGAPLRIHDESGTSPNRLGWIGRVESFADSKTPTTYWYFIVTDDSRHGRGHFVGYDAATCALVGYITPRGFGTTPPTTTDEFAIDGRSLHNLLTMFRAYGTSDHLGSQFTPAGPNRASDRSAYPPWIVFLHAGGRFLKIDLEQRKVFDLLEVDDVIVAGQVNRPLRDGTENFKDWKRDWKIDYALRCPDRVVLIYPAADSIVEYRLPGELQDETFTFYPLPNGDALYGLWSWSPKLSSDRHDLVWSNRAGEILQRRTVTLKARALSPFERSQAVVAAVAVPAPLVWGLIPFLSDPSTEGARLRDIVTDIWPAMLSILLVTLGLAVATDFWQRRYHLPRSCGWLVFVFLLGLPGFVGYLLHRRWPVRKLAPPPAPTGLEVFA